VTAHPGSNTAPAYSGHSELISLDRLDGRSITLSSPQSPNFSWSTLPGHIQDHPESPEVLLWHFRDQICPMLAMTDGKNNIWQTLVLPLVHVSETLYQAICAITTIHLSANGNHPLEGTLLMNRSIRRLRSELQNATISGATLATILMLAYWARWYRGSTAGRIHVHGAVAALRLLQSRDTEVALESLPVDQHALMNLLSDTCFYMKSLSLLVNSATARREYNFSPKVVLEEYFGQTMHPTPHPTDPCRCWVRTHFLFWPVL